MRLTQIRQILEIERCTSISQAARNLYISQPALSATLNEFENEIGVHIFDRTKAGVKPTEDGINILNAMKNIQKETNYIENYSRQANELSGDISIMVGTSYEFLFPELIQRFKKNFPKANLRLINNYAANVQNLVSKGMLDFAILALYTETDSYISPDPKQYNNLSIVRLKDCRSYAVVNKNHPKSNASVLPISELLDEQLILGRQYFAEQFNALGLSKYPISDIDRTTTQQLLDQNYAIFIDATPLSWEQYQINYPSYAKIPVINDINLSTDLEWATYLISRQNTSDLLRQVFLDEIKDLLKGYSLFY